MKSLSFKNGIVSARDVFVSSCGYEQTNVTFYQVVSVHGKKTAVVRRIRGFESASHRKKPELDNFIGVPIKRRINDCSDTPFIYINDYETAYQTATDKSHWYSSYY